MFDIGWTEMLVIAIVMIVVVGPKDLPRMLRTFGKTTAKLRAMAGDFQKQFNEALQGGRARRREEVGRRAAQPQPGQRDPEAAQPVRKGGGRRPRRARHAEAAPPPVIEPAGAGAQPAEPLKKGATAMPGLAAAAESVPPPAPVTAPAEPSPAQPPASPNLPCRCLPSRRRFAPGQRRAEVGGRRPRLPPRRPSRRKSLRR